MQITTRLVRLWEEEGLSVREAAKRLGVSHTLLYRIKTGERTPTLKVLLAARAAFGTSLDWLVPEQEPKRGGQRRAS